MIVVSMITVGYGDYNAKSYVGWLLSLLAVYFGLYLLSLFVICYFLEFDLFEKWAFIILKWVTA